VALVSDAVFRVRALLAFEAKCNTLVAQRKTQTVDINNSNQRGRRPSESKRIDESNEFPTAEQHWHAPTNLLKEDIDDNSAVYYSRRK
jgi:hypothetical protein